MEPARGVRSKKFQNIWFQRQFDRSIINQFLESYAPRDPPRSKAVDTLVGVGDPDIAITCSNSIL
jgi:hypothetical protein